MSSNLLEGLTAMCRLGKKKIQKEEGKVELLFGGEPHRLDEGQRGLPSVPSRAHFQFLPLHSSPLTRGISSRSFRRIARLYMQLTRYFGAQP